MDTFQVDIRQINCLILSAPTSHPKFKDRREVILKNLSESGFQRYQIVMGSYWKNYPIYSCALGHAIIAEQALLAKTPFEPHLILEDDALHEPNGPFLITVPRDADAVYLGVGGAAAISGNAYTHGFGGPYYTKIGTLNLGRVYNMLNTHAVLILSERFARNWQRCAVEASVRHVHLDILIALSQRFYNVYVQLNPLFYQAGDLENNERGTMHKLVGREIDHVLEVSERDHPASIAVRVAESCQEKGLFVSLEKQSQYMEDGITKLMINQNHENQNGTSHGLVPKVDPILALGTEERIRV